MSLTGLSRCHDTQSKHLEGTKQSKDRERHWESTRAFPHPPSSLGRQHSSSVLTQPQPGAGSAARVLAAAAAAVAAAAVAAATAAWSSDSLRGRPSQPTSWPLNACGCQGDYKTHPTRKAVCAALLVTWAAEGARRRAGVEAEGRGGERLGVRSAKPVGSSGSPGLLVSSPRRRRGESLKLGMIERPRAVWQRREGSLGAASAGRACPWAKVPPQAAEACDFANPGRGGAGAPPPAVPFCSQTGREGYKGLGPPGTSRLEVWWVSQEPIFLFGFSAKGWRIRMGTGLAAVWQRTGTFLKVVGAGSNYSVVQELWDTSVALFSLPLPACKHPPNPQAHSATSKDSRTWQDSQPLRAADHAALQRSFPSRGTPRPALVALPRWKEKVLGTRMYLAPRRFHEAPQEPPGTVRPSFLPAWWPWIEREACDSPSLRSQASSKLSYAPDTFSLWRTGFPRDVHVPRWVPAHKSSSEPWRRSKRSASKEAGTLSHFPI
ncbi:hypothetical protein Cadr_000010767 [Camelus dromedarius]|uniref:Uncharacterized protein n=1 Tax=Camelus dromedarius TaxID=9838 RepID=A0A5N4DR06_CAMDR|nr:hypothetical protein Cadr_000010767 [Camelus dromedarius]